MGTRTCTCTMGPLQGFRPHLVEIQASPLSYSALQPRLRPYPHCAVVTTD